MTAPRTALVAIAVAAATLAAGCVSNRGPRDVVIVTIDTLRADRVGVYGNPHGLTPNLDALAARGVRFADASATVPVTLPSHTSLFTGRYPTAHGVRDNGTFVVPDDEVTLAERLSEAGYRTGAVIASFPLAERYGLGQGFDVYDDDVPALDPDGAVPGFFPERPAGEITDSAIAMWKSMGDGPRFLWVHYFDPHAPYAAPEPWNGAHPDRPYDGEVAYVDHEVGRLLDAIGERRGDPLVIVTSDHGEGLGDHDEKTHGLFVYQSTMHVPLIVAGPGPWDDGRVVDAPVSLVDVVPTVLALLDLPAGDGIEGIDLEPLASGDPPSSRSVYGESFFPRFAFRFAELRMVRDGALKYIDAPTPELYDLAQDPAESRNLAGGHPDQAALVDDLADRVASEDRGAADRAAGTLDAHAMASLRSLGYVAGGDSGGRLDGDRGRDPKTMTAYVERHDRALGLLSGGRHDEGLAILAELREEAPENWNVLLQIAGGLIGAGRLDEASATLAELVEAAPEFGNGYLMLAEVQARLGRYDEAARNYAAAAAVLPWSAEPWIQLGRMWEDAGRFDEAARSYVEAIDREPSNAEAIDDLVRLRASRGDVAAAAADLTALLERHPDAADLHVGLSAASRRSGDLDAARAAADRAVALAPTSSRVLLEAGEVLLASDDPAGALERFRGVAETSPDSLPAAFGIARAQALLGRTAEADATFAAILERDPRFTPALTFQGRLAERRGDLRQAAALYGRAMRIDPGDREAWNGMQRVRAAAGAGPGN